MNSIEIIEESHSAKKLNRPKFAELVEKIDNGYANGLLVWSAKQNFTKSNRYRQDCVFNGFRETG